MPEADATADLRSWIQAGFGEFPLPETPKAWASLPLTMRTQLRQVLPSLAERFEADASLLPAAVRLRLEEGRLELQDEQALREAGFHAGAQWLERHRVEQMREAVAARLEAEVKEFQEAAQRRAKEHEEQAARAPQELNQAIIRERIATRGSRW